MPHQAIFLDRDGVINQSIRREDKPYPPQTLDEFEFVEGIEIVLNTFKNKGYLLIVFTNQPDIARGIQTHTQVNIFHDHIQKHLPIDYIYVCPHDDQDHCNCRKPKPGMIRQAQSDFNIDLKDSFVIGDRWKDIAAGNAAHCQTILINYNYNEELQDSPHFQVNSLLEILTLPPFR